MNGTTGWLHATGSTFGWPAIAVYGCATTVRAITRYETVVRVVLPPLSIAVTAKSCRPGVVEIAAPFATEPVHDCMPVSPSAHENDAFTT